MRNAIIGLVLLLASSVAAEPVMLPPLRVYDGLSSTTPLPRHFKLRFSSGVCADNAGAGTTDCTITGFTGVTVNSPLSGAGTSGSHLSCPTCALTTTTVSAGTGLSGGGDLSAPRTISMPNTGPGAGTVGGTGAALSSITLDAQGRVTAVTGGSLPLFWSPATIFNTGLAALSTFNHTYTVGNEYSFTQVGTATGLRFYTGFGAARTVTCKMYDLGAGGAAIASGTVAVSGIGVYSCPFDTPYSIGSGQIYKRYAFSTYDTAGYTYITDGQMDSSGVPEFNGTNATTALKRPVAPWLYMKGGIYNAAENTDAIPTTADTGNYYPHEPVFTQP